LYENGFFLLLITRILTISLHLGPLAVLRVPWYVLCTITRLLETNSYVRCLLIDFSKAFDVVDRGILAAKLT